MVAFRFESEWGFLATVWQRNKEKGFLDDLEVLEDLDHPCGAVLEGLDGQDF